MIVVDTNVVVSLLFDGPDSVLARRAWRRDREWVVPSLWRAEFLNVLVQAIRAGNIDEDAAHQSWNHASRLLGNRERAVDGLAVLRTASRFGITAYDAHFVSLAESLGIVLVTNDRKSLANKCPEATVVRLSSFAANS